MKNRKRNRLNGYDYSKNNLYFVTSCVKNMECCFGNVVSVVTGRDLSLHYPDINNEIESEMILNEFGIIVDNQLQWLEKQYPYISIHSYIVMPNHIHAIIEIDSNAVENIKIKPLSQILGAFKTTSSKLIHEANYADFAWHRSFHDHIIRDEKSYFNITNYIENNPNQWTKDTFYKS
jgi:putative transposase